MNSSGKCGTGGPAVLPETRRCTPASSPASIRVQIIDFQSIERQMAAWEPARRRGMRSGPPHLQPGPATAAEGPVRAFRRRQRAFRPAGPPTFCMGPCHHPPRSPLPDWAGAACSPGDPDRIQDLPDSARSSQGMGGRVHFIPQGPSTPLRPRSHDGRCLRSQRPSAAQHPAQRRRRSTPTKPSATKATAAGSGTMLKAWMPLLVFST